jgi:mRNA interferase RelE/StbE
MPKYQVFVQQSAQKEIEKLPKPAQAKVIKGLVALAENPRPANCKKLIGTDAWRVRVGEYRIVYWIEDNKLRVEIVRVAHRKDVYK